MDTKLQVFISSTYTDLKDERQEAVQAILKNGHIPTGMEYFFSGGKVWDTIKTWIDESDVYILILGERYGEIYTGNDEGISYTEMEYNYAKEKMGDRCFAVLIDEKWTDRKIKEKDGKSELFRSRENYGKLQKFREKVDNTIRQPAKNNAELQRDIINNISKIHRDNPEIGWIRVEDKDHEKGPVVGISGVLSQPFSIPMTQEYVEYMEEEKRLEEEYLNYDYLLNEKERSIILETIPLVVGEMNDYLYYPVAHHFLDEISKNPFVVGVLIRSIMPLIQDDQRSKIITRTSEILKRNQSSEIYEYIYGIQDYWEQVTASLRITLELKLFNAFMRIKYENINLGDGMSFLPLCFQDFNDESIYSLAFDLVSKYYMKRVPNHEVYLVLKNHLYDEHKANFIFENFKSIIFPHRNKMNISVAIIINDILKSAPIHIYNILKELYELRFKPIPVIYHFSRAEKLFLDLYELEKVDSDHKS